MEEVVNFRLVNLTKPVEIRLPVEQKKKRAEEQDTKVEGGEGDRGWVEKTQWTHIYKRNCR